MVGQVSYGSVTVESAVITAVDMRRWSVSVVTENSSKFLDGVPWTLPYLHHLTGEGLLIFPEVGASCLLLTPSDGSENPIILAYKPVPKGETYRTNRPDMVPGDMGFMGRDGNRVMCRRGGIIEIGTGTVYSLYLPMEAMLRSFAPQVEWITAGGEAAWEVDGIFGETQGATTRCTLKVRSTIDDTAYDVSMCLGAEKEERETLYSALREVFTETGVVVAEGEKEWLFDLTVGKHEEKDGAPFALPSGQGVGGRLLLGVNRAGDVALKTHAFAHHAKRVSLSVDEDVTVRCKGRSFEVATEDKTVCADHVRQYDDSVEEGMTKKIDCVDITLGKAASNPTALVKAGALQTMMNAFLVVADTPTGPVPVGRLAPGPAYPQLLLSTTTHTKAS